MQHVPRYRKCCLAVRVKSLADRCMTRGNGVMFHADGTTWTVNFELDSHYQLSSDGYNSSQNPCLWSFDKTLQNIYRCNFTYLIYFYF